MSLTGKMLKLSPNGQTWIVRDCDFVKIETLDGYGVRYLRRADVQMLVDGLGKLRRCPTCWGHGYTIGTCGCGDAKVADSQPLAGGQQEVTGG